MQIQKGEIHNNRQNQAISINRTNDKQLPYSLKKIFGAILVFICKDQ